MRSTDLSFQAEKLLEVLRPLIILGNLEPYVFASFEHLTLSAFTQAIQAGTPRSNSLLALQPILQAFIEVAENTELKLSHETEQLISEAKFYGIAFREVGTRTASGPLRESPTLPADISVFVDESGTASFDEHIQPVLCLVGVIIDDDVISTVEDETRALLSRYKLPLDIELHAHPCISGEEAFGSLDPDSRFSLLQDFLQTGVNLITAIHQTALLKPMMKLPSRRKLKQQGLDAYTYSVLWFVVTLDRVCMATRPLRRCKYYFDRTDKYRKKVSQIFQVLGSADNDLIKLYALERVPTMVESHDSRLIQLADVAGYFLNRYRQFEVATHETREALRKHESKILSIYEVMKPKLTNIFQYDAYRLVDWKALQNFSLNRKAQRPPAGRRWKAPVRRNKKT